MYECFTNNTFYAGVKSYVKYGGNQLSRLRLFAYIIKNKYTFIVDSIDKITKAIECDNNCSTSESMVNNNFHYEDHIISHVKLQYEYGYCFTWGFGKEWLGCFEMCL